MAGSYRNHFLQLQVITGYLYCGNAVSSERLTVVLPQKHSLALESGHAHGSSTEAALDCSIAVSLYFVLIIFIVLHHPSLGYVHPVMHSVWLHARHESV